MQLIPVLDLRGGVAVRASAGRLRAKYPLLSSVLAGDGAGIADLAQGLAGLRPPWVYVADLDAIEGRRPNVAAISLLRAAGLSLAIDAGLRSAADAEVCLARLSDGGPEAALVAGLESLSDAAALAAIVSRVAPERLLFSLDLLGGRPLTAAPEWGLASPREIAGQALACGVRRMIVLELDAVGTGEGPRCLPLCRELRRLGPRLELISGGGIRGLADLDALEAAGCDAALIGAALHEGRIPSDDFRRWNERRKRP